MPVAPPLEAARRLEGRGHPSAARGGAARRQPSWRAHRCGRVGGSRAGGGVRGSRGRHAGGGRRAGGRAGRHAGAGLCVRGRATAPVAGATEFDLSEPVDGEQGALCRGGRVARDGGATGREPGGATTRRGGNPEGTTAAGESPARSLRAVVSHSFA